MTNRVPGRVAGAAVIGWEFLATADASGDATIDFTAFDATKYDAYLFVLSNVVPANDIVAFSIRTSTDGGSVYDSGAASYRLATVTHGESDAADTVFARGFTDTKAGLMGIVNIGSAAGEDGYSGHILVSGPHLARQTHLSSVGSYIDNNGNFRFQLTEIIRDSAADVNAIRFFMSAGNIESGTITMYGMRNS